MKIAIVGCRDFSSSKIDREMRDKVWHFVEQLAERAPDTVIISGGARGVDSWGEGAARFYGLKFEGYPADWNLYGKSAGFRRNAQIVAAADVVVAFWDGDSRGTAHTVGLAKDAEKKLKIISPGSVPMIQGDQEE